jgi:type IV pilus assembly protein PilA
VRTNSFFKKGFTLIELLVVISIIGMLATVVLASFGSARESAQDVHLISDLHQLDIALTSYYNDNSTYPLADPAGYGTVSISDLINHLYTNGYIGAPELFKGAVQGDISYYSKCGGSQLCGSDFADLLSDNKLMFLPCGSSDTFIIKDKITNEDVNYTKTKGCLGDATPENSGCLPDAKALVAFILKRKTDYYRYHLGSYSHVVCFY